MGAGAFTHQLIDGGAARRVLVQHVPHGRISSSVPGSSQDRRTMTRPETAAWRAQSVRAQQLRKTGCDHLGHARVE